MSGSTFAVTPKLPAMLQGTFPIVVTKSGLSYTISYGGAPAGSVTLRQFISAVAILYNLNPLFAAINANANDASFIQFYTGGLVAPGDPIVVLATTVFALTAGQASALFTLAATLPD